MNSKREKDDTARNYAISRAEAEIVGRYGSAVKEHFVAYSGVDNEAGKVLKKGLKSISKERLSDEFREQNLKQQAGFSAEVKEVARDNAERIIKGDSTRRIRTDDLTAQKYHGNGIGGTNDTLYDHATIDKNGNVIEGSAAQMKFWGKTPKECFDKLCSQKGEKYLDADAKLEVPSDYYEEVQKSADDRIATLQKQADALKGKSGKDAVLKGKIDEIENIKKIKSSLQKSRVSSKEAMEARTNPVLSTAKDVARISHSAGMQGAMMGVKVAGALSLLQNIVACANGEKDADEAARDVVLATGKGAAAGYATAFAGSTIKGMMQNAGDKMVRSLSKSSLPAQIVTITAEVSKTLSRYMTGEIDGVECLEELGQKGTGMLSSAMFAAIGQAAIPIPVIGGMIGGMVGTVFNNAFYEALVGSLKAQNLAREERQRVEACCADAIREAKAYQAAVERQVRKYLKENITLFRGSFALMQKAIMADDIDAFIAGNVAIQRQLGRKAQFGNMRQFDAFMASDDALVL